MANVVKLATTQTGSFSTPEPEGYRSIEVFPASPRIGAEIGNIDLTQPFTEEQQAELKRAFTEYQVIFFSGSEDFSRRPSALSKCLGRTRYACWW